MENLEFQLIKTSSFDILLRVNDSASIPMVRGNRDYEEYLEWLAEGNEPEVINGPI